MKDITSTAVEIKISLISNPQDCSENLIREVLKKFFSNPKFLRLNDKFSIDIINWVPETKYSLHDLKSRTLYFKVNDLKTKNNSKSGFVIYNVTTVIQDCNVNSYIPCKCICDISIAKLIAPYSRCPPPFLREKLSEILFYINPFLISSKYFLIFSWFLIQL